jgi:hypothetical protein
MLVSNWYQLNIYRGWNGKEQNRGIEITRFPKKEGGVDSELDKGKRGCWECSYNGVSRF